MSKSIQNTTGSDIFVDDIGINIPASSTFIIPPATYPLWSSSVDVDTYINNGNFIINDGYDNLPIQFAKTHMHEESAPRSSAYVASALVQATTNSTLTLTAASRLLMIFTGTTAGQIIQLPSATTLLVGYRYDIWNVSSQSITIKDGSGSNILTVAAYQKTWALLQINTTSAGTWLFEAALQNSFTGGNGCLNFGYQGNANTNRYLEIISNNPTSNTPFVIAGSAAIRALSVSTDTTGTGTVGLYKNGVLLDSITITSAKKNTKLNLNWVLVDQDELSVKVTSGTLSRPNFTVWI